MPNAFTDITETEPTVEQIEMKTRGFFFPWTGATRYIMIVEKIATAKQYKRNSNAIKTISRDVLESSVTPGVSNADLLSGHILGCHRLSRLVYPEVHGGQL